MNGVHDMGGMHGFGKVEPEPNEPVFHAAWEGRVLAMQRAMGFARRVEHRHVARRAARRCRPRLSGGVLLPSAGCSAWSELLVEHGLVDADEIAAGHALRPGKPLRAVSSRPTMSTRRADARLVQPAGRQAPARFKPGDRVRTKNIHPRRTRGCRATCAAMSAGRSVHGCHVFPGLGRDGQGENPQWLYTVRVRRPRAVGRRTPIPTLKVSIEAFEPYLEPA